MNFVIDNEEYMTQEEVEQKLGLKQTSLYTLVRFGHFPKPIKLEVRKLWRRSEIDSYLEKTREMKETKFQKVSTI